ncbi:MAG: CopG family transcriptional regulator [Chlorogloea purpurea SAG 13.99]|jgi:hypothetical protein|nr:CopG family transcriptional regulator [Chlorogloea purpurea SAG 13.99]
MKPTIVYLPQEAEATLQGLADKTGKSIPEIIQEIITDYLANNVNNMPRSLGIGASGRGDLSARSEELLWTGE